LRWTDLQAVLAAYDAGLLLLAGFVGILTGLTTFAVYGRALTSAGKLRAAWISLNAITTGLGVWATNFIAVLAFDPGIVTTYDPVYAAASLLIAIALTVPVGAIVLRPNLWQVGLVGGAYVGCGIALVQISSLLALQGAGDITWKKDVLAAATCAGMLLSGAALALARPSRRWWARGLAALLLTGAVAIPQLMSAAGMTFAPALDPAAVPVGLSRAHMTVIVTTGAMLLVGAALSLAMLDRRTRRHAQRRLRELADAAVEGLVICENGAISDANAGFLKMLGLPREQLRGAQLVRFFSPECRGRLATVSGDPQELELIPVEGAPIPVDVTVRQIAERGAQRRVYAIQDLRERKRAEAHIRYLAHHDPLTGLANRITLHEWLAERLERAWETDEQFAVLCLDLDRFKEVNDVYGHAVGDAVLIEAARRMRSVGGSDDLIARLGGDEFVIVSSRCDPGRASALAERLIGLLSEDVVVGDQRTCVGLSIGISMFPSHGTSAEQLLSNADVALYRSKAQGRGIYCFFNSEMDSRMRERRSLAKDLADAIAHGALQLYFQPQARVSSLEVTGFEALARWHHPERGFIPPDQFVALAEENGLINELGLWVLRQSCMEAARWQRPLDIAVNLSPLQFQHGDLPEQILSILMETGLSPGRLELEITETVLIKDLDRALAMLRRLKALGLRIAMDDFGTGWSSLSTLQAFPFDKLKIDRTFIEKLGRYHEADVIVRAVLGLGRSLDLPVLAEGVETEQQLEFLRREGCNEIQGYLLGRPGPITNFAPLLDRAVPAVGRVA
jgi:diguanylate cyclase (GGDEF)-like protein/PAS domain S-box-containing protein